MVVAVAGAVPCYKTSEITTITAATTPTTTTTTAAEAATTTINKPLITSNISNSSSSSSSIASSNDADLVALTAINDNGPTAAAAAAATITTTIINSNIIDKQCNNGNNNMSNTSLTTNVASDSAAAAADANDADADINSSNNNTTATASATVDSNAGSVSNATAAAATTTNTLQSTKSAVSQRNVDIKIDKTSNLEAATQQLTKKVLKLDLGGTKNLDEYSLKSPKSPIAARLPHQTSLTSSVDVEDRKTLREALYQGIFHRHRRTIFAVGSFLRMLRSRNSQYNTIRSSSEGEDIDEFLKTRKILKLPQLFER